MGAGEVDAQTEVVLCEVTKKQWAITLATETDGAHLPFEDQMAYSRMIRALDGELKSKRIENERFRGRERSNAQEGGRDENHVATTKDFVNHWRT